MFVEVQVLHSGLQVVQMPLDTFKNVPLGQEFTHNFDLSSR